MITFPKPGIESFFRTLNIIDFDVNGSEDELVYSTNLNGYYNLWALHLDKGYPYQLTTVNQMNSFVKYDPNGRHILTGYDHDGDENYHIYALAKEGGETVPVLQVDGEKFYFGDVSKDGNTVYYNTSVGNPRFLNVCRLNVETGEQEVLLIGEQGPIYFHSVSPDERSFAYSKHIGNTNAFGYIVYEDEHIPVPPSQEKAHRVNQIEYLDNDVVLIATNYHSEFTYLATYQISTRTFQKLVEIEGFEIGRIALKREYGKVYFSANRGVEDYLYLFDLNNNSLQQVEKPFDIVNKMVVGDKGTLFVLGRSSKSPANLYRTTDLHKWDQLTKHNVIGVKQEDLSEPEVLTYSSFDGLEIEALYFAPKEEVDNGHTVLWPHGGPQHAEGKYFKPLFQYLCTQGYRVFAPNFRGSTGYGEKFMNMVNKDWGGGPRLDIIAGMDWLNQRGKSEADKWFCIGGSYGGYMTLLLHGRHPDKFKAFVDIFGPSNLFTTIETAPEHWKAADRELIGDPVMDREKLIEDSPMTYIDKMTKPMLVIQGANDPRVVKVESDVIVEAMKERGQDVDYVVLEDEGHGFSKTENALKVYKRMVLFLQKYL
jgi:dipeptidyl aminopeptidase/acylaminoacyl peptidase